MRALIWKEMRELAPGFWLLLLACWAVGVVDVAYNWNEDRGVGLSLVVCIVISLVAALLAGANSYARESREQIVFLGSWPISRGRIWLAKTLTPAAMWAVLVALGTGGCIGLLAMRGHYPNVSSAFDIGHDGWIMPMAWVLLYAMGLLASVALPSAMGATMVAAIALGAIGWGYLWAWDFVPARFGPRLGLTLPDIEATSHLSSALVLAALCVGISAAIATRALYRATWRRITRAAAGLAGGIVLVLAVALGVWLVETGRLTAPDDITMDNTGRYAMIFAGAGGAQGLWSLEVESGRLVRVARGVNSAMALADDAPRVAINWESAEWNRDFVWVGDLATGTLWRTDAESWTTDLSPDGRWLAAWDEGLVIYPAAGQGEPVRRMAVEQAVSRLTIAWAADGQSVYLVTTDIDGSPGRLLRVEAFTDAPPWEIAQFPPGRSIWSSWTNGQWTELYRPDESGSGTENELLNMRTGELMPLGEWRTFSRGWSADGQHAWVRREIGNREYEAGLLDLDAGSVVRVLGSEDFGGATIGTINASRHSPDALIFAIKPGKHRMRPVRQWWWLPDPQATEPKLLAITDDDRVGGWAASGEIILLRGRTVEALNPETGARRVIRELPGREPEAVEDAA